MVKPIDYSSLSLADLQDQFPPLTPFLDLSQTTCVPSTPPSNTLTGGIDTTDPFASASGSYSRNSHLHSSFCFVSKSRAMTYEIWILLGCRKLSGHGRMSASFLTCFLISEFIVCHNIVISHRRIYDPKRYLCVKHAKLQDTRIV